MIVEDEMLVRLGLKNSIDWGKYDMTIIADTSNGQEAWEVYEKEKPELIITDLKMPVLDGIELIKKIREKDENTKIIILSCLEDFEIARQAMSLGVTDYIPKLTMSRTDIEAVVAKVHEGLKKQSARSLSNVDVEIITNDLKEKFLKDCLFGCTSTDRVMETEIYSLNLNLHPQRLVVCVLDIDQYSTIRLKFNNERGKWISTIIMDTIVKVIEGSKKGEVLKDNDSRYIIIMSYFNNLDDKVVFEEIKVLMQHIRKLLKNYIDINISIGVSFIKDGYTNLKSSYNEAQKVSLFKICNGLDKTFFWNDEKDKKCQSDIINKIQEMEQFLLSNSFLSKTQRDIYKQRLTTLLKNGFNTVEDVFRIFYQLMYWNSVELSNSSTEVSRLLLTYQDKIIECETIEELLGVYQLYLDMLKQIYDNKRLISREVVEAAKYIQKNYETNPTLQQVADYVGLSPNYLSSLFKKELEQSFIEFMINIKIQKARNLLVDSNLKLYEIAEKVGFSDEAYFSRTFKKYTGRNPNSFRKAYIYEFSEESQNEDS